MVPDSQRYNIVILFVDEVVSAVLPSSSKAGCTASTFPTASGCMLGCFLTENCYSFGLKYPGKEP